MESDQDFVADVWRRQQNTLNAEREGLTLDRILETVIEIARSQGVETISMSRIAREVGFSPMALYRHVPNKAAMLEIAADGAIGAPPESLFDVSDWRDGLMQFARELGRRYRDHPWIFDVRLSGPPALPNSVRWMEACLRLLQRAGLPPEEQLALLSVLTGFVRGNEQMLLEIRHFSSVSESSQNSYGQLLSGLTTAEEYPALWGVIQSGVFEDPEELPIEDEHEWEMVFGIERIVAGIETMVAERATGKDDSSPR